MTKKYRTSGIGQIFRFGEQREADNLEYSQSIRGLSGGIFRDGFGDEEQGFFRHRFEYMPITPQQGQEMLERLERGRNKLRPATEPVKLPPPANRPAERKLHEQIMAWADSQWPRVKYIHSRMDVESTIQVGSQDFTIFLPWGKTLCVECKKLGEKQDSDQLIWAKEMSMLDHPVYVVFTYEAFLDLVEQVTNR